ncbi:SPOR domain-containing protein [Photobacterium aphoticum]|uniref:DedD n=1 Tax=Photobacterium aphoticum TaxID=754436 RepID=A0A0J1GG63_9GAMM|nr:SPOR domain-containing protein [Photobacterium aphoticum]KLU98575.1 DedD [Photobacterium aphoticum]PSU55689.1 cell division protein DedD [Photobacterium aphoticum]GHA38698.1 cell division protein DedD [Photobacterium aphoticum]
MASKFQSRLVGTIILVAIGVIFLPDLFDGQKQHYQEQFASIPLAPEAADDAQYETIPAPEFADVNLPPEPVTVVVGEDNQHSSSEGTSEHGIIMPPEPESIADQVVEVEPQPVAPPQSGNVDSGWVVQLGVFRNADNAHQLVTTLREKGYQAHVFPKQPKEGELARVVVGPDVSKDKLTAKLKELQKLTGLKGRLVRFNPLNP